MLPRSAVPLAKPVAAGSHQVHIPLMVNGTHYLAGNLSYSIADTTAERLTFGSPVSTALNQTLIW